jgi:cobalt-zinc-cadmium efflux system membrane fusion protein
MFMKTISLLSLILPTLAGAALEPVQLPDGAVKNLGLGIEVLEIAPVSDPVRATGRLTLDPLATAVVASPVSGRIEADTLRRGAQVKAGDQLLTLRSGERAASITLYLAAEQQLRFARAAHERESDLEARKLTTTEVLRERELDLAKARTAHLSAIQEMHLLGISERTLHAMIDDEPVRIDLSTHKVTAPIDGVIIEKMTTPGAPVERNAELLKIAALDHLLVEFRVPLRGVDRVREGAPVRFRAIVGDGGDGIATVTGLVPTADPDTLAATAVARLENPDGRWIAGTPVEILLDDPEAPDLPAVPVGAVVEIDGRRCVFVAEGGSSFRPQPVEVVVESGDRLGLKGVVADGTRVVTRGAALLKAAWEEAQSAE